MFFGPLCFFHLQKGLIEPAPVPAPSSLRLGSSGGAGRGLGTDRPGTQGLGLSLLGLAESLQDCLISSK